MDSSSVLAAMRLKLSKSSFGETNMGQWGNIALEILSAAALEATEFGDQGVID